jgi:hypothetical protein
MAWLITFLADSDVTVQLSLTAPAILPSTAAVRSDKLNPLLPLG